MSDLAPGGGPQATHSAAFYGSTAEFIRCVRTFIDQGLDGAEPVLVAVPSPSIRVLRAHLDGHAERVSWADMTRIGGNPARIIPAIRAFAGTYPGRHPLHGAGGSPSRLPRRWTTPDKHRQPWNAGPAHGQRRTVLDDVPPTD